ncbi:hypothetical protein P4E94_10135 [Pontiellaceae bacterium B12219]|nr:hypothetical protein [Pontiellaceae bacterium B12219]
MKKMILQFSALAALIVLSGCASSFQKDELDEISTYPAVQQQPSVYLDLAFGGKLNGKLWTETDKQNQDYLRNRCIQKLEESGLFSTISDSKENTDLQLYVAIIDNKIVDSSKMPISALTLFLVPYTTTDNFRMLALIKKSNTGDQVKVSLSSSVDHRQALWLAPLAPFKTSKSAIEICTDRIFENLCMEIYKTGWIK